MTFHRNFKKSNNKLFKTGKEQKAEEFENKRLSACKALNAIFYNKTEKAWFDFNLRTKSHNVLFYPSAIVPLYTNCYEMLDYDKSAKVIDYMNVSSMSFCDICLITASCKLHSNSNDNWIVKRRKSDERQILPISDSLNHNDRI